MDICANRPHHLDLGMSTKYSLHSKSTGRPSGTFREPVARAKAWHWLGDIVRIAGVDEIAELDRNHPRHPLSRDLSVSRRFESIQLDGYDPDRVQAVAPSRSLLRHFAEFVPDKAKYRSAHASYKHPLWELLGARHSRSARDGEDIQRLLRLHGLVRLDFVDVSHGMTLGLISEDDANTASWLERLGELPHGINDTAKRATLDALQLLLMLYREAQDMAWDWQVKALRAELNEAAFLFADAHGYSGEQFDTWHYLIQTRMLRWDPSFQPKKVDLEQAKEILLDEWHATPRGKGVRGRPALSPDSYTRGRAERRWRRKIWARACRLSLERESNAATSTHPFDCYCTNSAMGDWLMDHRDLIAAHFDCAVNFLMNSDGSGTSMSEVGRGQPPPLVMPASLYCLRERPSMNGEIWRHFGEKGIPYDVIPIEVS